VVAGGALVVLGRPSGTPEPSIPAALAALERRDIRVGGQTLDVVIAADQARGLMGIEDLGSVDGMLFVYLREVDPADHRFWMQGVLIPLDLAFFDGAGALISQVTMLVCPAADQAARTCPLRTAESAFRWALETEAGSFRFEPGARLEIPG
jgi:uncharacterized membrane protein (UPF0127 family)